MSKLIGGKTLPDILKMSRTEMLEHMRTYVHPHYGMCSDAPECKVFNRWQVTFLHRETDSIIIENVSSEKEVRKIFTTKIGAYEDVEIIEIERIE